VPVRAHEYPVDRHRTIRLIWLIYLGSGFCSLIDEVVFGRLLKLTLGNTTYANSILVSTFMGGLALGAFLMGRKADRVQRPLRLYALLECAAAISALAFPLALRQTDDLYRWVFIHFPSLSSSGLLWVQVLISPVLLLVPTMLMGSTMPLLARFVTAFEKQGIGPGVGRLYAVNMLGAVAGCASAGFLWISVFGVMGTLYLAAAVNLLIAAASWRLSLLHDPISPEAPPRVVPVIVPKVWTSGRFILLLAVFCSGWVSIGYELIWMRSIVFVLGNFTYVFSTVLTVYLMGNVIGVWIGSRLSVRFNSPALGFAGSLILLGVMGLNYPTLLTIATSVLKKIAGPDFDGMMELGYGATAVFLCLSIFLFILPSILMGIGFPLALQAFDRHRPNAAGRVTGLVYGVNTVGAVLGGVLTVFLLMPLMGVQRAVVVLGIFAVWTGTLTAQSVFSGRSFGMRSASLAVAAALTIMAFNVPPDLMAGRIFTSQGRNLMAFKEGITTTVTVHEVRGTDDHERLLSTSGTGIAGDGDDIRSAQKTLGHLGPLLHPTAKSVLSVGFGAGETTECLVRHDIRSIDCVEIAPELVDLALRFFNHINLGPKLHEHVRMIYMDAKNYLHLTDRRYDLILNDADAPHNPGSAALFTREHFKNAREHLNPGGLFITKLHVNHITRPAFNSVLGTFLEVFPHVTVWFPVSKPYMMVYLVGSVRPQRFDIGKIREVMASDRVAESLFHMNVRTDTDFFSWYVGDRQDIRDYLTSYRPNSDNCPFVEFYLGQEIVSDKSLLNEFMGKVRKHTAAGHIEWNGMGEAEIQEWQTTSQDLYPISSALLAAHTERNLILRLQLILAALKQKPLNRALRDQEDKILGILRMNIHAGRIDPAAVHSVADTMLSDDPQNGVAWLLKSWAFKKTKENDQSMEAGLRAIGLSPLTAAAFESLGTLLIEKKEYRPAVYRFQQAVVLKPDAARLHYLLGSAYGFNGNLKDAFTAFCEALRINPNNRPARMALSSGFSP